MRAMAAFTEGLSRVRRAPVLVLGACVLTLLIALPLSIELANSYSSPPSTKSPGRT